MASLSGSTTVLAGTETLNLSSPVQTDWIEFPQSATAPNRRSGGGSTIGLPTLLGSGVSWGGFAFGLKYTWTDGTPTASKTAAAEGIYVSPTTAAVGQGFQFTLPADTTERTVTIYWGANSCAARLVATLSDGSASSVTHNPTATGAGASGYYSTTLTYSAASAGQTLTIACTVLTLQSGGNTWLGAAKYLTSASSVTGAGASTQAANTSAAAGTISTSGAAASVQQSDIPAASGVVSVDGAAGSTQNPNASTAAGVVGNASQGTAASTQAQNSSAAAGVVTVSGTGSPMQNKHTASAQGAVSTLLAPTSLGITADVQTLEPGGLVELYEVDCTPMGGDVLRFHAHLQSGPILWQGVEYSPWPIMAAGFERTGDASQPAPTLTVANVDGSISALCIALGDIVGAKVKRHRTLAKYLDGQPGADPTEEMPVELWFVEQKTSETNLNVEFTLSSALDFSGTQLPARQVVAGLCQWEYKGADGICNWTGITLFDKDNNPTSDPSQDKCSKRLSGCKVRFGATAPLPFGGFPSAGTAGTL